MESDAVPNRSAIAAGHTIIGPPSWGLCAGPRLTAEMLAMLRRDEVAAVMIGEFITEPHRRQLLECIERHGMSWNAHVGLGPRQVDFADRPDVYFARAAEARLTRAALGECDPVRDLMAALGN